MIAYSGWLKAHGIKTIGYQLLAISLVYEYVAEARLYRDLWLSNE